jgi:hypothetical protein
MLEGFQRVKKCGGAERRRLRFPREKWRESRNGVRNAFFSVMPGLDPGIQSFKRGMCRSGLPGQAWQ